MSAGRCAEDFAQAAVGRAARMAPPLACVPVDDPN